MSATAPGGPAAAGWRDAWAALSRGVWLALGLGGLAVLAAALDAAVSVDRTRGGDGVLGGAWRGGFALVAAAAWCLVCTGPGVLSALAARGVAIARPRSSAPGRQVRCAVLLVVLVTACDAWIRILLAIAATIAGSPRASLGLVGSVQQAVEQSLNMMQHGPGGTDFGAWLLQLVPGAILLVLAPAGRASRRWHRGWLAVLATPLVSCLVIAILIGPRLFWSGWPFAAAAFHSTLWGGAPLVIGLALGLFSERPSPSAVSASPRPLP